MAKGKQQQFAQRLGRPEVDFLGEAASDLEIEGSEGKIFPNIELFVFIYFSFFTNLKLYPVIEGSI